MKRIETKRPSVLGKSERRSNPGQGDANFTPLIDSEILSKAEIVGAKDGYSYLRDILNILFAAYGNGKLGLKSSGRSLSKKIVEWMDREPTQTKRKVVKRNFKLRRKVYETALARWEAEAPAEARSATAMAAFLLESYGDGSIVMWHLLKEET